MFTSKTGAAPGTNSSGDALEAGAWSFFIL
jgi:hypothetical protein